MREQKPTRNQNKQANAFKKHSQDTDFFDQNKFKPFREDINSLKVPKDPKLIQELSLKCCGYGYFEDQDLKVQSKMKASFLGYLKEALDSCTELKQLKIEFSGFSMSDKILLKIFTVIDEYLSAQKRKNSQRDSRLEVVWIHTRMLKDCESNLISEMLGLTDRLISEKIVQISLQISGWDFKTGPLSYWDLLGKFETFAKNIMPGQDYALKRFKVDMSSWYISELEAYQFLRETKLSVSTVELIEKSRFDSKKAGDKSMLPVETINENREIIRQYITNIDLKFKIEHPIPGKGPKYITRDAEFQKRKKEYVMSLMNTTASKQDLHMVLNEKRGMPEVHKRALQTIREDIDKQLKQQREQIEKDEQFIESTNELEKKISERFAKFPFDIIMGQRVEGFHREMARFVKELKERLNGLQEFELDLRNWNPLFQMGQLKKTLGNEFAQEGGVRPILQGSKIVKSQEPRNVDEGASRLKCRFIM